MFCGKVIVDYIPVKRSNLALLDDDEDNDDIEDKHNSEK
jgi:hypothetical protein